MTATVEREGAVTAAGVVARAAPGFVPRLGIVLGSGLGAVAEAIEPVAVVSYAELPGFPAAGVSGHAGRLVLGALGGLPVACLQGRVHAYEGHPAPVLARPVRMLRAAGADTVLLTNAAGSLDPEAGPGSLKVIADHVNLLGINPLTGPNDDALGPRFPSLRDLYDPGLRAVLGECAGELGLTLPEGVYVAVAGPSFETPAEIRAFRALGADLVGMSTVPEAIAARHAGMRVAAISAITNLAEGLGDEDLSHAGTLAAAERAGGDLRRLVEAFCVRLAAS